LSTKHKNLVPFLKKCILSKETQPKLVDGCMAHMVRIQGSKATPFFAKLVTERSHLLRWVAAQNIVELRGKAGIMAAANALPLEPKTHTAPADDDEWNTKHWTSVFCNYVRGEMKEQDVDSYSDVIKRALGSNRWPVQVVGLQCLMVTKDKNLKADAEGLTKDKTPIPGWDEDMTIGELAKEVIAELET